MRELPAAQAQGMFWYVLEIAPAQKNRGDSHSAITPVEPRRRD